MEAKTRVAIVGATGLVGIEMRQLLASRKDLDVRCFASTPRPESGVVALEESWDLLRSCRYVLNASSNEVAEQIRGRLGPDQVLIDNASAFRMDPKVPLVVPEVNSADLSPATQVIANPNCTTIILCLGLQALKCFGIERVTVATYQAASGAGIRGLEELQNQLRSLGRGEALPKPEVFPFVLAGNVLSHNTPIRSESEVGAGHNEEEWKVIQETRKIMGSPGLPISVTCMRVGVYRAHTEAVSVDLAERVDLTGLRRAFASARGLKVVDDWNKNHFPMPLEAEGQDQVLVGRIRLDPTLPRTVHFLLSGDQIRKGAATNAVQIMDQLLART